MSTGRSLSIVLTACVAFGMSTGGFSSVAEGAAVAAAKNSVDTQSKKRKPDPARKAREQQQRKAQQDAARKRAQDAARRKAQQDAARKRAQDDARRKAQQDAARKRAQDDARRKAQQDAARKRAQDDARRRAQQDAARKRAQDDARRKAQQDASRKRAQDDARRQAQQDADRTRARDEARRRAQQDAAKQQQQQRQRQQQRDTSANRNNREDTYDRRERERIDSRRAVVQDRILLEETFRRQREDRLRQEREAQREAIERERQRAEAEYRIRQREQGHRNQNQAAFDRRRDRERAETDARRAKIREQEAAAAARRNTRPLGRDTSVIRISPGRPIGSAKPATPSAKKPGRNEPGNAASLPVIELASPASPRSSAIAPWTNDAETGKRATIRGLSGDRASVPPLVSFRDPPLSDPIGGIVNDPVIAYDGGHDGAYGYGHDIDAAHHDLYHHDHDDHYGHHHGHHLSHALALHLSSFGYWPSWGGYCDGYGYDLNFGFTIGSSSSWYVSYNYSPRGWFGRPRSAFPYRYGSPFGYDFWSDGCWSYRWGSRYRSPFVRRISFGFDDYGYRDDCRWRGWTTPSWAWYGSFCEPLRTSYVAVDTSPTYYVETLPAPIPDISEGWDWLRLDRLSDAADLFAEILAVHPHDGEARLGYAITLGLLGQVQSSADEFRRVLGEQPEVMTNVPSDADIAYQTRRLHDRMRDRLLRDRSDRDALIILGSVDAIGGRLAQAYVAIDRALDAGDAHDGTVQFRAWLSERALGQF